MGRAARWYAQRGWPIFPLRPRTKEPFAGLGVYNATSSLEKIGEWWRQEPNANIGLHCGGAGIVALDLDKYKDQYKGGDLLTFEDQETVTNLTGNNGQHLLYQMPDGVRWGNSTGNLPDGIDIRGHGGYIVLPPSVHPNGNLYRWEVGYGPHEVQLLPTPPALAYAIGGNSVTHRNLDTLPIDNEAVAVAVTIVEAMLQSAGLDTHGRQTYGAGRKWIFTDCPFSPPTDPHPTDKAAFIIVLPDGRISAGCQHQRCRMALRNAHMTGWQLIKALGAKHE